MRPGQAEAVIFDLDGTLCDTLALIHASFNHALARAGHAGMSIPELLATFGPAEDAIMTSLVGLELAPAAIDAYHRHYVAHHRSSAPVYAGVRRLLAALRRHSMPCAVVTGKGRRSALDTLRMCGWEGRFVLVAGDDGPPKPDPAGPLSAAFQLGVEPGHCLMVGDSAYDMLSGRAAGCRVGVAGWGPPDTTVRALAVPHDFVFRTPSEVLAVAAPRGRAAARLSR